MGVRPRQPRSIHLDIPRRYNIYTRGYSIYNIYNIYRGVMRPLVGLALVSALLLGVGAQSRRGPPSDDYEEAGSSSAPRPNMDVGQFPFQRGERAVFSFDQGDEGFIPTIIPLIEGLDKIKNVMNQQRKITQAFGEAFDQCEA